MDGTHASSGTSLLLGAMNRGDLLSPECPSRGVLERLTSRWGVLVLIALEGGTLRFSELRRKIGGVSERMLAQTLKQLEGDGLILRRALDVVPPHVSYSLTPMGREAAGHVRRMTDWIEMNIGAIMSHRSRQDP
ncbi:helix-turn-helix transcriptional regulator [Tabrizicola sp. J26]|uniref:winged helix-turn-helix transcriptional regulator n=1 Tax=Alitabrizicola rongguiensis TaxID=2909234 RepID=UPI001F4322D4|nr:helix-turn-helix domain-containing protein [Tabrizicola rongguiensis]MCF1710068.1 helix-turn-helix transcriptional regulator [Tabrizicola rongguiensis]